MTTVISVKTEPVDEEEQFLHTHRDGTHPELKLSKSSKVEQVEEELNRPPKRRKILDGVFVNHWGEILKQEKKEKLLKEKLKLLKNVSCEVGSFVLLNHYDDTFPSEQDQAPQEGRRNAPQRRGGL
jgi:hypothetical protein